MRGLAPPDRGPAVWGARSLGVGRRSGNAAWVAARLAVASVWIYEGLWCKVLGRSAGQRSIVDSVPGLSHSWLTGAVVAIGLVETGVAVWVLSGTRPQWAAVVQTFLLIVFNAGGLTFAGDKIAEPGQLLTQNAAFLALGWLLGTRRD